MRSITILRHGKAQPRDPANIPDQQRTLAGRGRKDAARMGKFYAPMVPDLIVSSPAVRAMETAHLFAESAEYQEEIKVDDRIYHNSASGRLDELLAVVKEQEAEHLAIVGHNPFISDLAPLLDGQGNRPIVSDLYLVTAASAHIVFKDLDAWQNLQTGGGQLRALLSPRFLKALSD